MRYRRAPAGGGMSIAVAVRAMSAVMRRAAVRGVVPCRISSVVSFLHLVEYRFPSHRTVRSFRRPACRFCVSCRIRLHCMACHTGLERRAAVFSVSLLSRLISSHCLIVSFRLVISPHLVVLSHLDTFCDTLRSIREAGRGCHSIIHMHSGF